MTEQKAYSPSRFWRLNSVFRKLTVEKCEDCGKGHLLYRLHCLNENQSTQSIPIEEGHGEIFVIKIPAEEVTS